MLSLYTYEIYNQFYITMVHIADYFKYIRVLFLRFSELNSSFVLLYQEAEKSDVRLQD